jgi:hypothetical protein
MLRAFSDKPSKKVEEQVEIVQEEIC